jgi:hypothetical protein
MGDDNWIALSAHTDAQRNALSELTGGIELAEWFAAQDLEAVVDVLAGAGIPAAAVVSPSMGSGSSAPGTAGAGTATARMR